ncbi:hypothetical protein UFOVP144_41 [uncultured Caudovirales phage]|uniref:Uncharacterized protein n=1 Tax=uncultured Caudovirales phage TaxID=2100421 RepID=A0A6J7XME9_9CAUD|nr:hypothetical protein UFOVP144_41 [uncultured Caudovirales phage]
MSNMPHCRFQNTKADLRDCLENFWNVSDEDEALARKRLVKIAKQIIAEYHTDIDTVDNCKFDEDAIDADEEENF